ncbi:MAG: alanine:cation symporter family protein [Gemmatimonadetes bacterium]|nr:alanine:cation symporter family protein [Gemmatimonadota bacterium]MYG15165.1 alanine:cation symporter family protein [Gemmatimonadota bacterium]
MDFIEPYVVAFSDLAWSYVFYLVIGGGALLLLYSRFTPFRYVKHAIDLVRGRYDDPDDPGDVSHFKALVSALSATIGMGNISGVAIAITTGGPGAIFWMWFSAFVGMATKFFTCSLAVMYRGRDTAGHIQGGPMYVISEGLGGAWKPLAVLFAVAGVIGCLPLLQPNQLIQIVRDVVFAPYLSFETGHFRFDLVAGLILSGLVATVIFGGITRIAEVASRAVPAMVVLYMVSTLWIILYNLGDVPRYLSLILTDAFTGAAVAGGVVGTTIVTGVRRAAFSNEAGIGTEALAHGAAKTGEPVREGLVAMMGPVIDTMIVCTCTALVILMTGVWQTTADNGVTLTASAFDAAIPGYGAYVLTVCVFFFAVTTLLTYSYYGAKCLSYLIGARYVKLYNAAYVGFVVVASVASIDAVISFADGLFALMAIPTMTSTLRLAPQVMNAFRKYSASGSPGGTPTGRPSRA